MINKNTMQPATETVKALAGTPMLLVLLLLNAMILAMVTYLLKIQSEGTATHRAEVMALMLECIRRDPSDASSNSLKWRL